MEGQHIRYVAYRGYHEKKWRIKATLLDYDKNLGYSWVVRKNLPKGVARVKAKRLARKHPNGEALFIGRSINDQGRVR